MILTYDLRYHPKATVHALLDTVVGDGVFGIHHDKSELRLDVGLITLACEE